MNGMFGGMAGGFGGIDPSKMSPQVIAELSELMRTLTPEQMMKMQTLMHNAMAGHNVTAELAAFEASLPAGFREKMARIMYMANGVDVGAAAGSTVIDVTPESTETSVDGPTSVDEARLLILRAVSRGEMKAEEALKVLFPK